MREPQEDLLMHQWAYVLDKERKKKERRNVSAKVHILDLMDQISLLDVIVHCMHTTTNQCRHVLSNLRCDEL